MRRTRPFHPPPTRDSFRDLLIFEERLKQNHHRHAHTLLSLADPCWRVLTHNSFTHSLQKQRRKYEAFLFSLVGVIAYLAYVVFLLPSIYSLVHYGNVTLLLVAVTTLVLFYATGMYSEKIAYAHKFVPQANRALRPFNIYLNTRRRSRFSLAYLFGSATPSSSAPPLPPLGPASRTPSSPSAASSPTTSVASISPPASPPRSPPVAAALDPLDPVTRALPPPLSPPPPPPRGVPLPPIPPAQNPRGELIFSSRVHPQFREGYERYRGEWERRRAEPKPRPLAVRGGGSQYQAKQRVGGGWQSWVWRALGGGSEPGSSDQERQDADAEEKGSSSTSAALGSSTAGGPPVQDFHSGGRGGNGDGGGRSKIGPRRPPSAESGASPDPSVGAAPLSRGSGNVADVDRRVDPPLPGTPRARTSSGSSYVSSRSAEGGGGRGREASASPGSPAGVPSSTLASSRSRSHSPAEPGVLPPHHDESSSSSSPSSFSLASTLPQPASDPNPNPIPASSAPSAPSVPPNPAAAAASVVASASRIRAESFSDLWTLDARSETESGAWRSPGLERSHSMRGSGGAGG